MGGEVTMGGLALLFVAMLVNFTIVMVNRQGNKVKSETNTLNFQSAYIELSEADRKRANDDHEQLLLLQKQLNALLDDNQSKRSEISKLQGLLEEAQAKMASDKATIEKMSQTLDAQAKQLEQLPQLQQQLDLLTSRIGALESEIRALKAEHVAELAARDAIIQAKEAELVTLRTENTTLKAQLATQTSTTTQTISVVTSQPAASGETNEQSATSPRAHEPQSSESQALP